ncbi:MAG: hypothetical protein HRT73_04585 [Flavobacteriales bacterium]|nr:hypothetical protein [Flavobacteriales bacterium]
MGFAEQMISSIRANNRRKIIHTPFKRNKKNYEKSDSIRSKEYTQFEKDLLSKKLKQNKTLEKEQHLYKLLISFGLTIIVIAGIVFAIKFTFF